MANQLFNIKIFLFIVMLLYSCKTAKQKSNITYMNSIFVDVSMNGDTGKFILDLGSQITVIDSQFAKKSNIFLDSIDYVEVTGAGNSEPINLPIYSPIPIKIADKFNDSSDFIIINLKKIIPVEDGIIGQQFFQKRIIKIDYETKNISEIQKKENIPNDYTAIPIIFINSQPYIELKLKINETTTIKGLFLIDTGSEFAIKLDSYYTDSLKLFENIKKKITKKLKNGGIGGNVSSFLIKANSVKCSKFEIKNILVNCFYQKKGIGSKKRNKRIGTIGNLFLEKFHLIINLTDKKIYLKPNKNYKDFFSYVRSGISIGKKTETGITIKAILNKSPAKNENIKESDIITEINNKKTTKINYFEIRKMLQQKGKIEMKILRNNEKIQKKFFITDIMKKL